MSTPPDRPDPTQRQRRPPSDQEPGPPPIQHVCSEPEIGGIGFGAVCSGLVLLPTFIAALTALITQPITLAAVILGGWIAVQILSASGSKGGTTVNIRKAVIKRNHLHG